MLKTFLTNLGKAVHDLVTSKKFLVGVLTGIVQALPVSQDLKNSILGIGGAVIMGQALADFGKNGKPPAPPAVAPAV